MEVDATTKFISHVQEIPILWKKDHKDFLNRDKKRKAFEQLSEIAQISVEECKKKIKNLKDRMREVCRKLPKTKGGQPAFDSGETTVRWPYYKPLLFMRDQFVGRDMIGNVKCTNPSQSTDNTADESIDETESIVSHQTEPSTSADVDPPMTNKIPTESKRQKLEEEFLSIEREKMECLKKELVTNSSPKTQDEWDTFTNSICSDLCKLKDPVIIMRAKARINKIVNDSVLEQISMNRETARSESEAFSPQLL